MIPSIVGQPAESNEKPTDVFAYLSIEDKKVQENRPKAMHGQIRKCNLTASRMVGGLILKEVQFVGAIITPPPTPCAISYCFFFFLILSSLLMPMNSSLNVTFHIVRTR